MTTDQQTTVVGSVGTDADVDTAIEAGTESGTESGTGPDALVGALLVVVDAELAAGPERRHVLSAALEVALLGPEPGWVEEARAEVVAEHASTVAALTGFPRQRGVVDGRDSLVAAADLLRDRRVEALDLALGLLGATPAADLPSS